MTLLETHRAADPLIRGRDVFELRKGHRIAQCGHGSSVLSPIRYSLVLALRGFGNAGLSAPGREHAEPGSLVYIGPTAADLAGIDSKIALNGSSPRPAIEDSTGEAARLCIRRHLICHRLRRLQPCGAPFLPATATNSCRRVPEYR